MRQIIAHYGELSTKGRNRKLFTQKLVHHIQDRTAHIPDIQVIARHDYMYISWKEAGYEELIQILQYIPGLSRFEPVYEVDKDIRLIKDQAVALFRELDLAPGQSFKVKAKRQDKAFPLDSYGIQREVGGIIDETFSDLSVDLDQPDYTLTVSLHADQGAYLSLNSYPGMQGLPYGSSGRGLLMLSGGFDSPVAGYMMIKRGLELELVHFASPPYTSPQALEKAKKLTAVLAQYGRALTFHVVPFTQIQEAIRRRIPDSMSMTVMRRMMLRIMDQLIIHRKARAIVNGESLGQVASQTIESMSVINEVTRTPIFRPLIATDKNDVIALAEAIGTAEISNEPYEDCCTVFVPKSPHTRPKLKKIQQAEAFLDIESLVRQAVEGIETEIIDKDYISKNTQRLNQLL